MEEYICVGTDVHDRWLVSKVALGLHAPERLSFGNTAAGRRLMIAELQKRARAAGAAGVVLAYEASGQGFGLYDELTAAGIRCHVLAPTRIARSPRHQRDKSDDRDAEELLALVRAHVLAGNELPAVWVPDPQTRDDRERVRMRLDTAAKLTRIKTQIRCLLKRNQVVRPVGLGEGWTQEYRAWLEALSISGPALGPGGREALGSLLRQLDALDGEIARLDSAVAALARTARHARALRALDDLTGVGVLTAMVFLTEMGDLNRFQNRRQVACYLGLVPSKAESGESNDRKGHITRQGPGRVRKVLCQASWARIGHDPQSTACYGRIVRKNPKHKKIAVVALMRRLAILMWHRAQAAQQQARAPGRTRSQGSTAAQGPAAVGSDERAKVPPDCRRSQRRGPELCRRR